MSKPKLNEQTISEELGAVASFARVGRTVTPPGVAHAPEDAPTHTDKATPRSHQTMVLRNHDTMMPRSHATTVPRNHDTAVPSQEDELIEAIRLAVRELGKEAATYRFTPDEKKALGDIIYAYKGRGIRTSENEITRIGVNYLIEDYRQNGANSLLATVLERLNL